MNPGFLLPYREGGNGTVFRSSRWTIFALLSILISACVPPPSPAQMVAGSPQGTGAGTQTAASPAPAAGPSQTPEQPGTDGVLNPPEGPVSGGLDANGLPVRQPGELIYAIGAEPETLLPLVGQDEASRLVNRFIYSSLLTYDEQARVVCDLCADWAGSPDGRTWTFTLRQGVRFHDGRPLTTRDVAFTYQVVNEIAGGLPDLDSMSVEGAHIIRFTLTAPASTFPAHLWFSILPAHIWEGLPFEAWGRQPAARSPVGSGPWRFSAYLPGQEIRLVANPDYYHGRPQIERIRLWIYPGGPELVAATAGGAVDLLFPKADQEQTLREQMGDRIRWYEFEGQRLEFLAVNHFHEALVDLRVRQAIAHALDRSELARIAYGPRARVLDAPIRPSSWAYVEPETHYPHNPQRARQLLEQAGRAGVQLRLLVNDDATARALADRMAQDLAAVGLDLQVQTVGLPELALRVNEGDFDLVLASREFGPEPDAIAELLESGRNVLGYGHPEVDEMLAQARATTEMAVRKAAYARVQQVAAADLPVIWLFTPTVIAGLSPRVEQVVLSPLGPVQPWKWSVRG